LFKYQNSSIGNKITVNTTASQVINANKTAYSSLEFRFIGEQITLVSHNGHWDVAGEASLFTNNISVESEEHFINAIGKLNFLGGGVVSLIDQITITSNRTVDLTGIRIVSDSGSDTQIKFSSATVRLIVTGAGFYFDSVRFTGVRTNRTSTSQYFLELIYSGVNSGKFEGCVFRDIISGTRNTTDGCIKISRDGGSGYNMTFTDCDFFTGGSGVVAGLDIINTSTSTSFLNVFVFAHKRSSDNFNKFQLFGSSILSNNGNFYTEGTAKVDTTVTDNRFSNLFNQMTESLIKLNDQKTSLANSDSFLILDSVDDELKYVSVDDSFNKYLPLDGGTITGNLIVGGNLTSESTQFVNITTVNSTTYDLATDDYILHVTTAVTSLTLPTAQVGSGRTIIVKDGVGNAVNDNIVIDTEGTETIDGQNTFTIDTNYESVTLYCDGSNWFII
jgi:hypothetical protein